MRLMIMWADNAPEMKILFDELRSAGHEIVYWVGLNGGEHLCPPGAIFHDHYDARNCAPAPSFASERIEPVSADRIEELYRVESLILTMYNKMRDASGVDERKRMYYDQLAYWTVVLEKTKPDAIIFPHVPHSIYNLVLYFLAKEKGLLTLMFEDTWVGGRMIWFTDYEKGSDAWRAALEANKTSHPKLEDLNPHLQTYYKSQTGASQIKPAYMLAQKDTGEGWPLFKHRARIAFRSGTRTPKLVWNFLVGQFKRDLRDDYRAVAREPDLKKPFIYFPLGYQPERTTSPQGDVYHDQILAAQTLAAALPEGWEIYVKEHPSQWWLGHKTKYSNTRYRGFYDRLAAIPKVRIVPIHFDSHVLIEHAKTVATITGTAGWESLFRLKKPILFGFSWYIPVPYLFRVRSVEDCKRAIEEIRRDPHIKTADLLRTLKSFEEATVTTFGYGMNSGLNNSFYSDVEVNPAEAMRSIAKNIRKWLE